MYRLGVMGTLFLESYTNIYSFLTEHYSQTEVWLHQCPAGGVGTKVYQEYLQKA